MGDRGAQHVHQHRLVARGHDDDVGDRAEVGDVERAVVGGAVVPDQPGAVHREGDVEALQGDVVDDLVVGALEEGRVDRADRLRPLKRQPRGEQDGVLLGDADVVVLLGALVGELLQAGPPAIAAVIPITRGSRLASATIASANTSVYCGGALGGAGFSSRSGAIDSGESDSFTATGFGFGAGAPSTMRFGFAACHFSIPSRPPSSAAAKPLPLTVWMWTTTGPVGLEGLAQGLAQVGDIVAVDHPDVGEVELLEEQPRRPVGLDRRLDLGPEPLDPLAQAERQLGQPVLDPLAGVVEAGVQPTRLK